MTPRRDRPSRLRRSELSTPASSEKMMIKAAASEADLVFLDLEDSVAASEKERCRPAVIRALRELQWGRKTRAVRINGVDTAWCYRDVIELVSGARECLDVLIVPKVKHPKDVWFVDTLLTELEADLRLPERRIGLEVLIEEVEALAAVEEIARCCDRMEALILGVGDLAASQGMRVGHIGLGVATYPGDVWHYARTRVIVAARAAGLDPIDGPYADFSDDEGYRTAAHWSATLGAVGKWAIHPSQIAIANEVYSPTEEEIERAKTLTAALEAARDAGDGAASVDGQMIDAVTARFYRSILDTAKALGRL
jgi:citrate lyase subunit beta / citryl-CoA lyase